MGFYNVKVKTFSDGTKQYMYSEKPLERDYELAEERNHDGLSVERKEKDNLSRARSVVYDLARSNRFDWFISLTFSPQMVSNRWDYDECSAAVKRFTHKLCLWGNGWIIVPERHKNGAFHFHGLVQGELNVCPAINPYTGKQKVDKNGRLVFNLNDYEFGFTEAVKTDNSPKLATYLTEYFTKDMCIPKGRKRYWASRALIRPQVEYLQMFDAEFGEIFNNSRYQKEITGPYGNFLLCET